MGFIHDLANTQEATRASTVGTFGILLAYLIIHDVVDGFGGRAVSEGGLHVDHLIGDDSQGPPVALHPIAGLPTTERGQNLWREEVLGTSRKLGRANLSTGKQKEPIIFQVKLLPYSSASIPGLIKDLFDLAMEMLHESIMNNSEYNGETSSNNKMQHKLSDAF